MLFSPFWCSFSSLYEFYSQVFPFSLNNAAATIVFLSPTNSCMGKLSCPGIISIFCLSLVPLVSTILSHPLPHKKMYHLFMAANSVDVLYLFPYFFSFFSVSDSIIHSTMNSELFLFLSSDAPSRCCSDT